MEDVIYASGDNSIMNSWGRFTYSSSEECQTEAKKRLKVDLSTIWNDPRFNETSEWLLYAEENIINNNELNFVAIRSAPIADTVFNAIVEVTGTVEEFSTSFIFNVVITPANINKAIQALPPVMTLVKMSEMGVATLEFNAPLIVFDKEFDAFMLDPTRFLKFEVIKNPESWYSNDQKYIESGNVLSV